MKTIKVDILSQKLMESVDAICFTSNGFLKSNDALVMGAGVARQFKNRFPSIDFVAGKSLKKEGNICRIITSFVFKHTLNIVAFPTKHDWRGPSDIELINKSAIELVKLADKHNWKRVALPAPGVGLGGLDFNTEVKPLLETILDDRFIITFKP